MLDGLYTVFALIGLVVVLLLAIAFLAGDSDHVRTCPRCGYHALAREFGLGLERRRHD